MLLLGILILCLRILQEAHTVLITCISFGHIHNWLINSTHQRISNSKLAISAKTPCSNGLSAFLTCNASYTSFYKNKTFFSYPLLNLLYRYIIFSCYYFNTAIWIFSYKFFYLHPDLFLARHASYQGKGRFSKASRPRLRRC